MKIASVKYAVNSFDELRAELEPVIVELGLPKLTCMVRQHPQDIDRGWMFYEIGLDVAEKSYEDMGSRPPDKYVFWGKMKETGDQQEKKTLVFLDPETIDSIEFEVHESSLEQA